MRSYHASFLVPVLLGCAASATTGCTDAADPTLEATSDPLIYGADDRRDFYQLSSPIQLAVADATAAVISNGDLTANGDNVDVYVGTSFGSAYALCSTEPYRTQPTTAWCTAFRVGPDLVATAGHCITTAAECADTSFVFGFYMTSASAVRSHVPASDVYRCAAIVARTETSTNDWAIIRVDRAIEGHPALQVRRSGKVADGAALVLSGYPAGLPLKVAGGASVRSNTAANYFQANVDAYGGNSGSPVVDAATGVVEGVLVRGNADFVYNRKAHCYTSNVCADGGCPNWEEATRTTKFSALLPCGGDGDCSDGNPCNGDEVCAGGACGSGTAIDCGDGNACTTDACVSMSGSAACNNNTIACNDGNACTTDACDPATGCNFAPIVCSGGQSCVGGTCVSCQPVNATCTSNSQCCSGSCNTKKNKCR